MGRPLGSKNKPVIEVTVPERQKSDIHYDLVLCIRAFRDGRFKGLWELTRLKKDGTREMIVDATSRQSLINMAVRQMSRIVIA